MGEIPWLVLISIFIDGSNIWGVDRTDPWGPEMDHPPLGRSYLVVVPSYDMSGALILLTGLSGWDSMAGIDINPSSMGPIFGCVDRTDPWGPEMDHPPLGRSYLVVVPSYDMSGALILLTGLYGWDSMAGIDINPSPMGPIYGCVDRTDPWGPEMDHPPLGRSYLVVVPSYDMSGALILLTGLYGWDSMAGIDINLHRWVQYLGCG